MKEHKRGRTPVEEAVSLIENAVRVPGHIREIPLSEALGRVLSADFNAEISQPPFTRSPVDGYGLKAEDICHASQNSPVYLETERFLPAGCGDISPVSSGKTVRIMTGAPVPEGVDCIVPQEFTDQGEKKTAFFVPFPAGSNICQEGEDIKKGDCLIPGGTRLTFAHLGLLAGQGIRRVNVYENPRVAVMATGDELIPTGVPLAPGKIYDSNSLMLWARMKEMNIEADLYPAGADDLKTLSGVLDRLLKEYDFVITTGGVSVGKKDYMPQAAELAGAGLLFHGIGAKPGSPVLAAAREGSVLLALSGNPFASIATFELLAPAALARLSGDRFWKQIKSTARLCGTFDKPSPMRRFIRARTEGGEVHIPPKGHSSGGIGTLSGCNCLIDVPAGSGALKSGDLVKVWLF